MTQPQPKLSNATLHQLPETIAVPQYDRSQLKPGIVHFGIGPFSRAHVVAMADDLANKGHMDCGVVGISFSSGRFRDPLAPQDFLYSLQEQTPEAKTRVIGSLLDILVAAEDPASVIDRMAHPDTHLVTLTITQKGYHYVPGSGLQMDSPAIRESLENKDEPKAAVGFIVAALERRMKQGLPPFTVMSCDNINHNGSVLRHTVLAYASRISKELMHWIDDNVAFPQTMVDRITPSYKPENSAKIAGEFGYDDAQPVLTEQPYQFIIEGGRAAKLPPFDEVGAEYVDAVAPYELAKIRLLNGMHMALGIIGRLKGYTYADEALQDPVIRKFMEGYMGEVKATLDPIEGFDYDAYISSLFDRVSNPLMKDELQRLARSGIDKLDTRFIGPLKDAYARDTPRAHVVYAVAAWITYLQAADAQDNPKGSFYIEDSNAYKQGVVDMAKSLNGVVAPILAHDRLWNSLATNPNFERELQDAYSDLTGGHRDPDADPKGPDFALK